MNYPYITESIKTMPSRNPSDQERLEYSAHCQKLALQTGLKGLAAVGIPALGISIAAAHFRPSLKPMWRLRWMLVVMAATAGFAFPSEMVATKCAKNPPWLKQSVASDQKLKFKEIP